MQKTGINEGARKVRRVVVDPAVPLIVQEGKSLATEHGKDCLNARIGRRIALAVAAAMSATHSASAREMSFKLRHLLSELSPPCLNMLGPRAEQGREDCRFRHAGIVNPVSAWVRRPGKSGQCQNRSIRMMVAWSVGQAGIVCRQGDLSVHGVSNVGELGFLDPPFKFRGTGNPVKQCGHPPTETH